MSADHHQFGGIVGMDDGVHDRFPNRDQRD